MDLTILVRIAAVVAIIVTVTIAVRHRRNKQ
jgi:hypothetical protein